MLINVNEGFKNCAKFNKFIACELPLKSEQERQKRNLYICGHAPINPQPYLSAYSILNNRLCETKKFFLHIRKYLI